MLRSSPAQQLQQQTKMQSYAQIVKVQLNAFGHSTILHRMIGINQDQRMKSGVQLWKFQGKL